MRKKFELRQRALRVAEKIAKSFLEEYRNGPYANELSTDRMRFWGCSNYPDCKMTADDKNGKPVFRK